MSDLCVLASCVFVVFSSFTVSLCPLLPSYWYVWKTRSAVIYLCFYCALGSYCCTDVTSVVTPDGTRRSIDVKTASIWASSVEARTTRQDTTKRVAGTVGYSPSWRQGSADRRGPTLMHGTQLPHRVMGQGTILGMHSACGGMRALRRIGFSPWCDETIGGPYDRFEDTVWYRIFLVMG